VLECWLEDIPIPSDYLILDRGRLTGLGARSHGIPG
jgi:hypothetical protein